jgi:hypothetical protein
MSVQLRDNADAQRHTGADAFGPSAQEVEQPRGEPRPKLLRDDDCSWRQGPVTFSTVSRGTSMTVSSPKI